ncbi:MAG: hypothetical protein HY722_00595 [Planctomycetes bacterium]|nr:hypothetical protein [Planctomycetota bacterium]
MTLDFPTRRATVTYALGGCTADDLLAALRATRKYGGTLAEPVSSEVEGKGVTVGSRSDRTAVPPGTAAMALVRVRISAEGFTISGDAEHPGLKVTLSGVHGIQVADAEQLVASVDREATLSFEIHAEEKVAPGEYLLPFHAVYVPHVKDVAKKPVEVAGVVPVRVAAE